MAAPSIVQYKDTTAAATTSITQGAWGTTPTEGNLLIQFAVLDWPTSSFARDATVGENWTLAWGSVVVTVYGLATAVYWKVAEGGTKDAFKMTWTGSHNASLKSYEVSGAIYLDATRYYNANSSTWTVASHTTITSGDQKWFAVAFLLDENPTVSTKPTDFDWTSEAEGTLDGPDATNGPSIVITHHDHNAESFNPSEYTGGTNCAWVTYTCACSATIPISLPSGLPEESPLLVTTSITGGDITKDKKYGLKCWDSVGNVTLDLTGSYPSFAFHKIITAGDEDSEDHPELEGYKKITIGIPIETAGQHTLGAPVYCHWHSETEFDWHPYPTGFGEGDIPDCDTLVYVFIYGGAYVGS
jgi:hypothetical protein